MFLLLFYIFYSEQEKCTKKFTTSFKEKGQKAPLVRYGTIITSLDAIVSPYITVINTIGVISGVCRLAYTSSRCSSPFCDCAVKVCTRNGPRSQSNKHFSVV